MLEKSVPKISPLKIFTSLLISKFFDLITTYYSITTGTGYEANPITAHIMNTWGYNVWVIISIITMLGVGFILVFVQDFFIKYDTTTKYIRFCYYVILGCILLNVIVVLNNFYIILT